MTLYFVRHTDALPGLDDTSRPLSSKGTSDAARIGKYLRIRCVRPDAAFTSPLLRAKQTLAGILTECARGKRPAMQETDALLNETSPNAFSKWLRTAANGEDVLLVGHSPTIGERVSELLQMKDALALHFSKGAIACVETEDCRRARLEFFLRLPDLPE